VDRTAQVPQLTTTDALTSVRLRLHPFAEPARPFAQE